MNRVTRFLQVLILIQLAMACACVGPSPKQGASDPKPVVLRLIRQESVPLPPGGTPQYYTALAGPGDDLWLCAVHCYGVPQVIHRFSGRWSKWERLTTSAWCASRSVVVEPDAAGRPVVIWIGCDGGTGTAQGASEKYDTGEEGAILFMRWTGKEWTSPTVIDRSRSFVGFSYISSLRDRRGRIHLVYNQKYDPPESYGVGFPIVDGKCPSKCAHVIFDGEQWSEPRFTTGRGEFNPRPLELSEGPAGLVLGCKVSNYEIIGPINLLEYQVFDGQKWGGWTCVAIEPGIATSIVADAWGHRLIAYGRWNSLKGMPEEGPAVMYMEGQWGWRRDVPKEALCEYPHVTTDSAGRIALLSGEKGSGSSLRVWNGAVWSKELAGLPEDDWLCFGRSHLPTKLLLVNREAQGFVLYEIAVEEQAR